MPPPHNPWLIARLFDFSFSRFVSLALIRIVYFVLAVLGLVPLLFGVFILYQIGQDYPEILLVALLLLVLAPFIYLIYLFFIRLVCETLIVLFAMVEHLDQIREALQASRETQPPPSFR
jgi:hypothetical protein